MRILARLHLAKKKTKMNNGSTKLAWYTTYVVFHVRLGTIADQFQNLPFMQSQGQVYINGIALNADIQDWYARKTGYVLQLAVPYYEELTVRQNLFFAAHMRLPKSMSHVEKFERVEQILAEVFKLFYSPFLTWLNAHLNQSKA